MFVHQLSMCEPWGLRIVSVNVLSKCPSLLTYFPFSSQEEMVVFLSGIRSHWFFFFFWWAHLIHPSIHLSIHPSLIIHYLFISCVFLSSVFLLSIICHLSPLYHLCIMFIICPLLVYHLSTLFFLSFWLKTSWECQSLSLKANCFLSLLSASTRDRDDWNRSGISRTEWEVSRRLLSELAMPLRKVMVFSLLFSWYFLVV